MISSSFSKSRFAPHDRVLDFINNKNRFMFEGNLPFPPSPLNLLQIFENGLSAEMHSFPPRSTVLKEPISPSASSAEPATRTFRNVVEGGAPGRP